MILYLLKRGGGAVMSGALSYKMGFLEETAGANGLKEYWEY